MKKSHQPTCIKLFKALSDPTRLSVMKMLLERETYVSEFIKAFKVEPTLLSHHLSILKEEGLIQGARQGKTVLYRLNPSIKIKGRYKGFNLMDSRLVFTDSQPPESSKKESRKQ